MCVCVCVCVDIFIYKTINISLIEVLCLVYIEVHKLNLTLLHYF